METTKRIDLNTAEFEELVEIPGIHDVLAQRIVKMRPFDTFDDVVRIKGIGPTSLQKLASYATVNHNVNALATGDEKMEVNEETRAEPMEEVSPEAEVEEAIDEVPANLIPLPPLPPVEPWVEPVEETTDTVEEIKETIDDAEAKAKELEAIEAELPPPIPDELPPVETLEEEEVIQETEEETLIEPLIAEEKIAEEIELTPAEAAVEETPFELPEAEKVPPKPVPIETPAPKTVKRGQLVWTSIVILFLAIVAAVALSVGIVAGVNNGNLQFASPSDVNRLSQEVNALEGQGDALEQTLDGVQARLDNLEALSGRIDKLETNTGAMQGELDTLASEAEVIGEEVAALNEETTALGEAVDEVQAQTGRFQTVMDGLRDLLNNLFPTE